MADAQSEALRQTCLNKEHVSLLPRVLHPFILKLEHEEVKAWVQKEEFKAINARIWGHATKFQAFTPIVAKAMTTAVEMGGVSSKLMCCWAFASPKINRLQSSPTWSTFPTSIRSLEKKQTPSTKTPLLQKPCMSL
jgi:hypothetical protein